MELALILAQAVMAFLSGNRDPTIVSPGDPSGIIALRQYEEADTAIPFPSGKSGRDFLFRTDDEWFVQTENGRF